MLCYCSRLIEYWLCNASIILFNQQRSKALIIIIFSKSAQKVIKQFARGESVKPEYNNICFGRCNL